MLSTSNSKSMDINPTESITSEMFQIDFASQFEITINFGKSTMIYRDEFRFYCCKGCANRK